MFMRYRGSGIGHRYMREIEDIYENMSRERLHHRKHTSTSGGPANTNTTNHSDDNDDEHETEGPAGAQPGQAAGGDDSGLESDSEYLASGTDSQGSHSSGGSDSEEFDSEDEVADSYGLGDL